MYEKVVLRILFFSILSLGIYIIASGIYYYFYLVENSFSLPYGNLYYGNDVVNINRVISGIGLIVLDVGFVVLIKNNEKFMRQ